MQRDAERFAEAARALDAAEMSLYAAAARRRAAELANQRVEEIDDWMRARQIQNPARWTTMMAPYCP